MKRTPTGMQFVIKGFVVTDLQIYLAEKQKNSIIAIFTIRAVQYIEIETLSCY